MADTIRFSSRIQSMRYEEELILYAAWYDDENPPEKDKPRVGGIPY